MRRGLAPLIVLALLAGSLAYLIWWDRVPETADTSPLRLVKLIDLAQDQVTAIELRGPYPLTLRRQGGEWVADATPAGKGVDQQKVENLLWAGAPLYATQKVVDHAGDPAAWGLAPPVWTVTVIGPEAAFVLQIGRPQPLNNTYYVQRAGDPAVYLIPSDLPESIPAERAEWFATAS